jgi:hypothetical protein
LTSSTAIRADARAKTVIQRLCELRWRCRDVARPVALVQVAIERELAHAQDLTVAERLVHPSLLVIEDPQPKHLLRKAIRACGIV